jgi:hypothetical protein
MSFSGSCSVPAASNTCGHASTRKVYAVQLQETANTGRDPKDSANVQAKKSDHAQCPVSQSGGEVMQACLMCRQVAQVACTCYGRHSFHRDPASSGRHSNKPLVCDT